MDLSVLGLDVGEQLADLFFGKQRLGLFRNDGHPGKSQWRLSRYRNTESPWLLVGSGSAANYLIPDALSASSA